MRVQRYLVVSIVLAFACEEAAPADTPPAGRFGVRVGLRGGSGRSDFGLGFTGAIVAGYHPMRPERHISFGAEWSAGWSFFQFDDNSLTGSVRLTEFDLGARIRVQPSKDHLRLLVLGAGALLLRSNVPIPPRQERSYVGPYISLGIEPKVGDVTLGFDVRYGVLFNGPSQFTFSMIVLVGR